MSRRPPTFVLLIALALAPGCYVQEMRQGPAPECQSMECRQWRAVLELDALRDAVLTFHAVHHRYPVSEEGLAVLAKEKILGGVPRDPWGMPYHYGYAGGVPVVSSLGADRKAGGEGEAEDIWEQVERSDSRLFRDVSIPGPWQPAFPRPWMGR